MAKKEYPVITTDMIAPTLSPLTPTERKILLLMRDILNPQRVNPDNIILEINRILDEGVNGDE
jgi:hypothetical protein